LNAHMQGATNLAPLNFRDNADNNNPIVADLYVPDDAVAVNKVDVKAKRQSFRGFVRANQTSESGLDTRETSDSSETGEFNNSLTLTVPAGSTLTDPSVKVTVPDSPTGTDAGVNTTAKIFNGSDSVDRTFDFDIINDTTNTTLDSKTNVDINRNSSQNFNFSYDKSQVSSGDTLRLDIEGTLDSDQEEFLSHYSLTINSKSSHDHEVPTGTDANGDPITFAHDHEILAGDSSYGIFEPDNEPEIDVELVVDGNSVQTFSNVSLGDEIGPIDVQPQLSTPLAGEYHEIKLVPKDSGGGKDGRSRFTVDVNGKIFIESTLQ